MPSARLVPVSTSPSTDGAGRVNVFIHGYRAMASEVEVEKARARVAATGAAGESYLLDWTAGRWRDAAAVTAVRAAYKARKVRYALSPLSLLLDAGLIGAHEAAQFKWMEGRSERVGLELPDLLREVATGRPINLIGHSLGARVVHRLLAEGDLSRLWFNDAVLLAGAADLNAEDWPDCVARLGGRLYNVYSRDDRILQITPDLRRRVGRHPLPQVMVDGEERVVNHRLKGVGHVQHWTRLPELLSEVWPACCEESHGD
ncbi:hypothetical protein MalM25_30150 [Planctomycetes bacterium MalM25]|nr:hypothetical protein MalM25_30150 [Planctomycetes bacterium MalM25]